MRGLSLYSATTVTSQDRSFVFAAEKILRASADDIVLHRSALCAENAAGSLEAGLWPMGPALSSVGSFRHAVGSMRLIRLQIQVNLNAIRTDMRDLV